MCSACFWDDQKQFEAAASSVPQCIPADARILPLRVDSGGQVPTMNVQIVYRKSKRTKDEDIRALAMDALLQLLSQQTHEIKQSMRAAEQSYLSMIQGQEERIMILESKLKHREDHLRQEQEPARSHLQSRADAMYHFVIHTPSNASRTWLHRYPTKHFPMAST
eukprot:TRINITY_DN9739_c0_g1_i1.p3 TRINITY_DN9739_c0_g1~~TRINITY_DN9739_c0_g1_i1.p3  ORF type:complete len:164 (+),score=24.93 TRINITY_DN9739_c0_g1_i1:127-618(+)